MSDTFDEKITPPHPLDFEVLEPRIMLDATGALVWSLTDAAALDNVDVIASMSELYEQFEAQFDAETADGILASLQARFDDGLLGGQDLVSIADGQDGTRFGELSDTFERVRLAIETVVDEYRGDLDDLVSNTVNDVATEAQSYIAPTFALDNTTFTEIANLDTGADPYDYLLVEGTEFYSQTVVQTAGNDTATMADDEYAFGATSATFDFWDYLSGDQAKLDAMKGGLDNFDEGLTAQIRSHIDGLDLKTGTETLDTDTGIKTQATATDFAFSAAALDDMADFFTQKFRSANDNVDPSWDTSSRDYVVLNDEVVSNQDVNLETGEVRVGPFNLIDYLTDAGTIEQFYSQDALFEDDLGTRIDQFFDNLTVQFSDVNAAGDEPTALLDLIIDADSRAYFKGLWTFAINNTLNDLDKATDVDLLDLQCVQASDLLGASFMQFNSTVANTISVTVTLPTFDTALNQLELDAKLRAAIPVNFNFGTSETELQFDLTAQTDTTAGAEGVGVSVGAFAFTQNDAAFEFGRPSAGAVDDVTGLSSLTEIPLGMLTGTLSDVETGQFGLYSDFQNAMGDAFAATVGYAQGTGITTVDYTAQDFVNSGWKRLMTSQTRPLSLILTKPTRSRSRSLIWLNILLQPPCPRFLTRSVPIAF